MSDSNENNGLNFDLDKAVQQWCELVLSNDSIKNKNIEHNTRFPKHSMFAKYQ